MKKIFGLIFLILILWACSTMYNYKSSYHAPSILYETGVYEHPEDWEFYMHDSYGRSYKARSISTDGNSISGVIQSVEPIELPEKLSRNQFHRRNEVHVFVNDQKLVPEKRLELKANDVKEVMMYTHPKNLRLSNPESKTDSGLQIVLIGSLLIAVLAGLWITQQATNAAAGCYIATMAYGSYDATEVLILRKFRDEKLKKTFLGRVFIANYYALSPFLVKFVKKTGIAEKFIRRRLDRFVQRLKEKHNW
ncbi:MAG: hypothetical protein HOH34_07925 [Flavobacteriales bacterium]|nr:hypothetical protein [Flavobacteriales bacterium]